nr:ribbon-helix-helix domain-containing protein [Citrobacter koseri]
MTRIPKSRLLDEAIEDLLRKHGISDLPEDKH